MSGPNIDTWIVSWPAGSQAGLTEGEAERLCQVLYRTAQVRAERRRDVDAALAHVRAARAHPPEPRIDGDLVQQVREGLHMQPPFPPMTPAA
jgi:hypothetical protein